MVVGQILAYSALAIVLFFVGLLFLLLCLGGIIAMSDFCFGTNLLGRKTIPSPDTQYTGNVKRLPCNLAL